VGAYAKPKICPVFSSKAGEMTSMPLPFAADYGIFNVCYVTCMKYIYFFFDYHVFSA
jgi:hypothetical protein